MKTRQLPRLILSLFITLIFAALILPADNAGAASLKERMKARLPQITRLKAEGVIGENNRGFLELRRQETEAQVLINAENQDRQTVYNAIAEQQNTTPEIVGQLRAAQIVTRAPTGTWLQNKEGKWFKK